MELLLLDRLKNSAGPIRSNLWLQKAELLGDLIGDTDGTREGGGLAAHSLTHLSADLCSQGWTESIESSDECFRAPLRLRSEILNIRSSGDQICAREGGRVWYPRSRNESAVASWNVHVGVTGMTGYPYVGSDGTVLT